MPGRRLPAARATLDERHVVRPRGRNDEPSPQRSLSSLATRPWVVVLFVFVVALAARLVHVAQLRPAPFFVHLLGDSVGYDAWAQSLAQGDWLGKGIGVFYQAPLYPYALGVLYAIFGRDLLLVRLAQALVGAVTCALVARAGMKWFGRAAGLVSGLLLAAYAPAIFLDGLLQKSVLDGLLVASLLLALGAVRRDSARVGAWAGVGVSLGLLALNRENALALVPVVLAFALLQGDRRTRATLIMAGALVLVLAPVGLRNWVVGGEFQLTTFQLGSNFYMGNGPTASGTYVPLQRGHESFKTERQDAVDMAQRAEGRALRPSEVSRYWLSKGLEWIRSNPGAWLRLTMRKCLLLLNATEAADSEDLVTHAEWSAPLRVSAFLLHFGLLAPLALLGAWVTRNRWRELWPLYLIAGVTSLSVVCFYVLDRYRYPLVPLAVLFAGAGVVDFGRYWREHAYGERAKAVLLCAAALVVCNWPLLSSADMQAVTHYNTGVSLEAAGLPEQAESEYRAAIALEPGLSAPHSNLGGLLSRKGDQTEALAQCRQAVGLDPESVTARVNLAIVLGSTGRIDEAVGELNRALELDPRSADAHYNMAKALMARGQASLAAEHLRETLRLDPSRSDAHNNLGVLLCSEGRLAEGIEQLKTAVALAPQSAEARANLEHALALARQHQ